MRGHSDPQSSLFSYVDLESLIPKQHPIRAVRQIIDTALSELEPEFEAMYSKAERPSCSGREKIRKPDCAIWVIYSPRTVMASS